MACMRVTVRMDGKVLNVTRKLMSVALNRVRILVLAWTSLMDISASAQLPTLELHARVRVEITL